MSKRFWLALCSTSLLLLAACGNASDAHSSQNNVNPGTSTNGPVSISTNHTTYAPTDSIEVSITNHLPTSIFAFDTQASCSILGIQRQLNGTWQDTQIARCSLGRPAMLVEIPSTKVYTASISAGSPGLIQATFPSSSYRLILTYSTSATRLPQPGNTTTIYSATFVVASPT